MGGDGAGYRYGYVYSGPGGSFIARIFVAKTASESYGRGSTTYVKKGMLLISEGTAGSCIFRPIS